MSAKQAACVVIRRADGCVLAVSRHGDPSDLGFPGGKVEAGESSSQAAYRELREETGVDVCWFTFVAARETDDGYLTHVFFAVSYDDSQMRSSHEGEVRWARPEELKGTFGEYNQRVLRELPSGKVSEFADIIRWRREMREKAEQSAPTAPAPARTKQGVA